MSRPVRLAVIIVSYNVRDLLRTCLNSVAASTARTVAHLDVETVVVDNASTDGSAAMVADEFPCVHLIGSWKNLGFTGGNNAALRLLGIATEEIEGIDGTRMTRIGRIEAETNQHESSQSASSGSQSDAVAQESEHSTPDYVLLLNPDAEVTGDAFWQMVAFLERNPHAAVCGAGLRYGNGAFQHSAFHFPGIAQVFLDLFPPTGLRGAHRLLDSRLNGRYPAALWTSGAAFAVDFVLGAAMMVRSAAISEVGGLDDSYWMYCEEMDWCRRFQRAGWTVHVLPAAQVIHHEAQSSRQRRWATQERLWRSRFRFYAKHADAYAPGTLALIRLLVRAGMRRQARRVEHRFAAGEIDGVELEQAMTAIAEIARL